MAATMLPKLQHIGALTNLNPNTKISRGPSSGKKVRFVPTTRFTSSSTVQSKYKPQYVPTVEEERYHRLLAADPRAFFHADIQTMAPGASSASPTPNMSLRRDLLPRVATPTTPPVTSK